MKINESFGRLADEATVARTVKALKRNGMAAHVVATGAEAKAKVLELVPAGADVMNMTSMTLEGTGVVRAVLDSGRFKSVRKRLSEMDDATQLTEKRQRGAAPEWAVGSVHAVTEAGEVLIASNTGSQLPAYAYGAQHVVWVVGTHKIVKDVEAGLRRLYEYSLPLENERAKQAYGMGSAVNKILIINKEVQPGRISIIFVGEKLGF